jgi:hypothetical protein
MKIETNGYIADGRLVIQNRMRFDQDIKSHPDADVIITIRNKGKRTSAQNSYYWAVVVKEVMLRFRQLGHDVNDDNVHEFLKGKFNTKKVANQHGELAEMPYSTTELNKEEFSNYCEMIKMWAADFLEITIPDPGVQTEMTFSGDV